ncbi:MAG: hypothetical protein IPK21_03205 [Haliscomenobacter sp.]|nr:hypothetical protein [Haliscomenobacter sp.]
MITFSRITALLVSISLWGVLYYEYTTIGKGLLSFKPRRLPSLLIAFSLFSLALAGQGSDAQLLEYLKREALSPGAVCDPILQKARRGVVGRAAYREREPVAACSGWCRCFTKTASTRSAWSLAQTRCRSSSTGW